MQNNKNLDPTAANRVFNFLKELQSFNQEDEYDDTQEQILLKSSSYEFFVRLTHDCSFVKAKVLNYVFNSSQQLSKLERSTQKLTSNSFSYGEIPFLSLARTFQIIKQKLKIVLEDGGTFYDLGSGTGKSVIAVALLHPFKRCIGIELLESLHKTSLDLLQTFHSQKHLIEEEINVFPEINFIKDDINKFDWSDGTFVYASSTCYEPLQMQSMCEKALLMKQGSYFITLTKALKPEEEWILLNQFKVQTSWGEATLYIQVKRNPSRQNLNL